ncbi:MAG: response regulator, partial [Firmicutes bacterium]|nr:response regulator [Bacillota bacterium]
MDKPVESLKSKVLLIDDDEEQLVLFYYSFRDYFEIIKADSVDSGLAKLAVENPDIIITDYEMPGKTGLDLLTEI